MNTLESHGFDAAAIQLESEGPPVGRAPDTPEDQAGSVTVAVGSDDPIKVARAQEAISELDPIEVERVDEHGDPV